MLSKRYYKAMIDIVKSQKKMLPFNKEELLFDLAEYCREDNPNFDNNKFWKYYYKEDK